MISLLLVNHHTMSAGPDHTLSLLLLPISIWLLFAIFSLKVVLSSGCSIFSCNFGVFIGGGELWIPCHLDWQSIWCKFYCSALGFSEIRIIYNSYKDKKRGKYPYTQRNIPQVLLFRDSHMLSYAFPYHPLSFADLGFDATLYKSPFDSNQKDS